MAIPISTVLTNILIPLALLLLLLEGNYRQPYFLLRSHPIAIAALSLFAFMVIALSYTPASWSEAIAMLDKYRELLYIPLFILLFQDSTTRHWGLLAFCIAMSITLGLSYFVTFTGWQIGKGVASDPAIFKNYITQGIFMAIAAYFLTVWIWQQQRWRWSFIVILMIYNMLFMTAGRTGYLILACLGILFLYQLYQWRGVLVSLLSLVILSGVLYFSSTVLQQRVDKIFTDMEHYQHGETIGSAAIRYDFLKNTLLLIKEHPIIGTGTGSFNQTYQKLVETRNAYPSKNPHSEYLMITAQWGLIGLGLLFYLFYRLWQTSNRLEPPTAWMAQGLVVTMVVGCLINSLWLDTTEGHLFAYLIGLLYAPLIESDTRQNFIFRLRPAQAENSRSCAHHCVVSGHASHGDNRRHDGAPTN